MAPPPPKKPPAPAHARPAPPRPGPAPPAAARPAAAPARTPARKLVVFGASGRVGSRFVKAALDKGHAVTVYTRNANAITQKHPRLVLKGGNISDDTAIREAVAGQDTVVVALGARDISKAHSVCSDAIKRIVAAMRLHGVKRVVMVGNVGLLPHPDYPERLLGEAGLPPFLEFVFVDQRNALKTLQGSALDWVMVCPPFMPLGATTGKYRVAVESALPDAQGISVEDVVHFLVGEVFEPAHHGVRVALADPPAVVDPAAPKKTSAAPPGTVSVASLAGGMGRFRR